MSENEVNKLFHLINECDLDKDYDELLKKYSNAEEIMYFISMQNQKNRLLEKYYEFAINM